MPEASRRLGRPPMRVLTVDIGGTHIKVHATGAQERRMADSGPDLSARDAVAIVRDLAKGWDYDAISIGYPGPVLHNRPARDPKNLGAGWRNFDFAKAFGVPALVVNDALLQAIGGYDGGRMLFLGLGTGLGSALIIDKIAHPLELAHLPYRAGRTYEEYLGAGGLKRLGRKKWRRRVDDVVTRLRAALLVDYVVIGGGNVAKLGAMPEGARRGTNDHAFSGGERLWEPGGIVV